MEEKMNEQKELIEQLSVPNGQIVLCEDNFNYEKHLCPDCNCNEIFEWQKRCYDCYVKNRCVEEVVDEEEENTDQEKRLAIREKWQERLGTNITNHLFSKLKSNQKETKYLESIGEFKFSLQKDTPSLDFSGDEKFEFRITAMGWRWY